MRDHWFPRNCRKQFVKSHAPAAAGRDDDGAKHVKSLQGLKKFLRYKVTARLESFRFNSCNFSLFNFLAAFALPCSAPCRQRDRRLSPATLSSPRPSASWMSRRLPRLFRAQLLQAHRRSSLAANTRLRSTIPLFPCSPIPCLLMNDLRGFGVTQLSFRARFCDSGVFQCRFEHAQHAEFRRVPGTHRLFQIQVQPLLQCHAGKLRRRNTIVDLWPSPYGRRRVRKLYEAASRFAERSGYRAASRSAQLRTESASLTDTTSTSLQVRRNKPASTPPGPSSIKNSQPRPLSRSMQSSQRTVPVT